MTSDPVLTAQWVGNLILFAAGSVALWYAWEARKQRLQMICPKVVSFFESAAERFGVRNVGQGVALNIMLDPIFQESDNFELQANPSQIPFLAVAETAYLTLNPATGGHRPNMAMILSDSSISLSLTCHYSDVDGKTFATTTVIGGGARIPFIRENRRPR